MWQKYLFHNGIDVFHNEIDVFHNEIPVLFSAPARIFFVYGVGHTFEKSAACLSSWKLKSVSDPLDDSITKA